MSSKLLSLLTITITLMFLSQPANGMEHFSPKDFYNTCSNSFSCGNITEIRYPFRRSSDPAYCGHPGFTLECHHNNTTTIEIMDSRYYVLEIDQNNQTLRIIRTDIQERSCPDMTNTTLDVSLFDYTASCMNYTFLYGCPDFQHPGIAVPSCGNSVYVVGENSGPGNCETSVIVPVVHDGNRDENRGLMNSVGFNQSLHRGFEISWKINTSTVCRACEESNGRCGYNYVTNQTTCMCPNPPFASNTTCPIAALTRGKHFRKNIKNVF